MMRFASDDRSVTAAVWLVSILAALVLSPGGVVWAGEVPAAEEPLVSTLKELFTRDLDAAVVYLVDEEVEEDAEAAEAGGPDREADRSIFSGRLFGEVEYRYSGTSFADVPYVSSNDLGIVLGYEFDFQRNWDFKLALKTGRDRRPDSGWVDLDDPDGQQWLHLKEYWGRYRTAPGKDIQARLQFGSYAQPDCHSQLVFDSDLHRPGANLEVKWAPQHPGLDQVKASLNVMRLQEAKPGLPAADVVSTQLDLRWELTAQTRLETSLGYHDFRNPGSIQRSVLDGVWLVGGLPMATETTNYTDYGGGLTSSYRLVDAWIGAELFRETNWPLELELEYVHNTAADAAALGRATAYFAGLGFGKDNNQGDWRFGVEHAYLEPDAVLAAVNRGGYATNQRATRLDLRYVPWDDVTWRLTRQWSESIHADAPLRAFDEDQWRFYVTYSW